MNSSLKIDSKINFIEKLTEDVNSGQYHTIFIHILITTSNHEKKKKCVDINYFQFSIPHNFTMLILNDAVQTLCRLTIGYT